MPFPSPGDLPDPGIELRSPALQADALTSEPLGKPFMTTGKTITLTRWTFDGKVMSLLLNMPSRLVIAFLQRSKHLSISWLQSPSAKQSVVPCMVLLLLDLHTDFSGAR